MQRPSLSHYEILGVKSDADFRTIDAAYEAIRIYWNPLSSNKSPDGAHLKWKDQQGLLASYLPFLKQLEELTNEAYRILSDSKEREVYDRTLYENTAIKQKNDAATREFTLNWLRAKSHRENYFFNHRISTPRQQMLNNILEKISGPGDTFLKKYFPIKPKTILQGEGPVSVSHQSFTIFGAPEKPVLNGLLGIELGKSIIEETDEENYWVKLVFMDRESSKQAQQFFKGKTTHCTLSDATVSDDKTYAHLWGENVVYLSTFSLSTPFVGNRIEANREKKDLHCFLMQELDKMIDTQFVTKFMLLGNDGNYLRKLHEDELKVSFSFKKPF